MAEPDAGRPTVLDEEISGLEILELPTPSRRGRAAGVWARAWPPLAAAAIALGAWQAVVLARWRPDYLLPGPTPVLRRLLDDLLHGDLLRAMGITLSRVGLGYLLALFAGTVVGLAVARIRPLRRALGSLIVGLQTMPSIAWFPLAILLFRLSETAILFVVVLGAAPAVANGLISGIDHVPPVLLRAGRVLGARGFRAVRHVLLPAALPGFVAGMKQGWAFAWRSLMAGELLVVIAGRPSIGVRLQFARELSDAEGLVAVMVVILVVGIAVDALAFGTLERTIRRRRGLLDPATA